MRCEILRFDTDKKGYDTEQVDNYINSLCLKYEEKLSEQRDRVFALKHELQRATEKLDRYVEKDKQISKALVFAVEKADEIETGAAKIYDLEIKRVRLLYKRWEELLYEVENKYPEVNANRNVKALLETFKQSINDVLEQNLKLNQKVGAKTDKMKDDLKKKGDNYIKNILNKMEYALEEGDAEVLQESRVQTHSKGSVSSDNLGARTAVGKFADSFAQDDATALGDSKWQSSRSPRLGGVASTPILGSGKEQNDSVGRAEQEFNEQAQKEAVRLKSISDKINKLKIFADGGDIADGYLNSDFEDDTNNAYAKNIARKKDNTPKSPFVYDYPTPNESGFDLKAALNPKDDLDTIMQSFDFFNDNNG